jgi:hypothetical protein
MFDNATFDHFLGKFAAGPMGDRPARIILWGFTGNGIQVSYLLRCVLASLPVIRVIGKDDFDNEFPQCFFIAISLNGVDFFLGIVPANPPSSNGFPAQTNLGSDFLVVLSCDGEQNGLGSPDEVLRRIATPGKAE